jgi:hypothetical protein
MSISKNVRCLHVFGDSILVIQWMQDQTHILNLGLMPIAQQMKEIVTLFQEISFIHIYKEHNNLVNSLSKEALLLPPKYDYLDEFNDDTLISKQSILFN